MKLTLPLLTALLLEPLAAICAADLNPLQPGTRGGERTEGLKKRICH